MSKPIKSDLPLMAAEEGIVLFYPHVPRKAKEYVSDTLDGRWIGQGPKVEQFEPAFRSRFDKRTFECKACGGTRTEIVSYR
jgi:perosamine synthetase